MRSWWAIWCVAVGAIVLAVWGTTPPAPRGLDTPTGDFAAARAMVDLRVIARAPHPSGSAENLRVRAYLQQRLTGMGLQVRQTEAAMSAKGAARLARWSGSAAAVPAINVVGVLAGRDRSLPAVLLMAHHDSVWGSPGAADDGAGVAVILETVRALTVNGVPNRDLIVLLTDGEELGLEGAKAFFARDPLASRIGVVVNMEARGGGGRASMFETGADNGAMMRLFADTVHSPVGTSLSVLVYKKLPNSTDFTPAKAAGKPGFNFAFIGRPGSYHSPLATADALDQGSVQDMGRQVLDLTRALLGPPVLPGRAADLTFFDAFGIVLVAYPAGFGWVLLVAAAGLYGAAAWRERAAGEMARGAGATVLLAVLAGVLLYAVNAVSVVGTTVNYYDRLAAIPRLQVQAGLVCLAAFVLVWSLIAGRRRSSIGLAAGAAAPLLALGAVAQWSAPTASYPILWPLLLGGVAAAVGVFRGAVAGRIASVVVGVVGLGYMIALGFFLLQAVGPGMPSAAALPLVLGALLLWPLMPAVGRRAALVASAVLLLAAVGIALWVRFDPIAASVAVYGSDH